MDTSRSKLLALEKSIDKVYNFYLESKKYKYALLLYKLNLEFYNQLLEIEIQPNHLVKIYLHFNAWFLEFEFYEDNLRPNLDDDFLFQTEFPAFKYPKLVIEEILKK